MNFEFRQQPIKFTTAIVAICLGILVGSILILIIGENPIEIYSVLIKGAIGNEFAVASTLRWMTPLLFTSIAAAIAFRGGMFNIGVEGQMYLGAFAAAWAGFTLKGLPPLVLIFICILVSAGAGLLWAYIPALLKVYFGASEVVTTLMLNYVAILFTDYLVVYHFLADGEYGQSIVTNNIDENAKLPLLMPPNQVHLGIVIGIFMVFFFYLLIQKSKLGYEISISGLNPEFAQYGGINVNRVRMTVMLISGAIAGIGGATEVLGINYRFVSRFSPDFGFDGITAALLGGNSPIGVLFGSLFMGMLKAGSLAVERYTDVSRSLATIIQGVIICFVSATLLMNYIKIKGLRKKENNKRKLVKEEILTQENKRKEVKL